MGIAKHSWSRGWYCPPLTDPPLSQLISLASGQTHSQKYEISSGETSSSSDWHWASAFSQHEIPGKVLLPEQLCLNILIAKVGHSVSFEYLYSQFVSQKSSIP